MRQVGTSTPEILKRGMDLGMDLSKIQPQLLSNFLMPTRTLLRYVLGALTNLITDGGGAWLLAKACCGLEF